MALVTQVSSLVEFMNYEVRVMNKVKVLNVRFLIVCVLCLMSVAFITPLELAGQKTKAQTKQDVLESQRLFDEAIKLRIMGETIEAEVKLRDLIVAYPFNDAAYYELAKLLNDRLMFVDARVQMEQAIKYSPSNKWYYVLYAQILSGNGEYKKAVDAWKDVVKMDPTNLEYYNELAIAYVEADEFKKAINTYNVVEKKFGISEEFSIKKHKIWLAMDNKPKAILELKQLADAFPYHTKYRSQLAELYMSQQDYDMALEQYKKVAEINPDDEYIHITLSDFYRMCGDKLNSWEELKKGFANPKLSIETKMNVVRSYNKNGDVSNDEIEQRLNEMISILATAHDDNPFVLNLYGETLIDDGKIEEAKKVFYRSASIDSANYEVWQRLMLLEWDSQNSKGAMKMAEKVITLLPNYPISYMILGMGLMSEERWSEAIGYLESGVKFVTNDDKLFLQFYLYLGDCYHQIGNDEKTFEYYDKCLKIEPNNSYVLNNYAYFLSNVDTDRLEEAKKMSEKAIEYEPDSSAAMDTYGWILYKLGDYAEAEKWIRKAIDKDKSNSSEVVEHLGDAIYKQGRVDEAVVEWKKAMEANGTKGDKLELKVRDGKLYE